VVIAVAADPIAVVAFMETPQPEPEPEPQPEPEPESEPEAHRLPKRSASAAPAPPPSPRPDLEYGGRLGVGFGGLVLPGAGAGFSGAPFVGVPRFHARLVGQYWLPRRRALPGLRDAGATFQLATGGVRACPILQTGRWRFPLCAGVDVGAIIGNGGGSDLEVERSATALWAAVVLEPGVEVTLTPRWGLWAAFEGAISLNRPRFHFDGGGSVHAVGAFGPRGMVGVVVHNRRRIP
jgi:hypothetical protein